MNINVLALITIFVVIICSFGYLAVTMLADWKASGKTKGALFSNLTNRFRPQRKRGVDCFEACMKRFAWNVDQVSFCTSKCKA